MMPNKIDLSEEPTDTPNEVRGGEFYYNTRQGILYIVGIVVDDDYNEVPRLFSMRDGMIYSTRGLFGKGNSRAHEFVQYNHSFEVNSHLE